MQVWDTSPGAMKWCRIELLLLAELDEGWWLQVDGDVVASTGSLDEDAAKAWANEHLRLDVAWLPGWPNPGSACWFWADEPIRELLAAQAERVLNQLLRAQAAGDSSLMAAIRARLHPHEMAAVAAAAERELADRLINETEIALDLAS